MKYREICYINDKKTHGSYIFLTMKTRNIARESKPGQFINIRVADTFDPLLRRPMSICDADGDYLSVLVQVKGRATKLLAEKDCGDPVNIIGPLGTSFPVSGKKALFIAGGTGIAPFLFLSRFVKPAALLMGVRTSSLLPDLELFTRDMNVKISSDDGSAGTRGRVLELLKDYPLKDYTIYACGPNPMLKAISGELKKCPDAAAYYSVETMMGCGFGACRGCAVESRGGGYKLACTDGPVFKWDEVKL